MKNNQQFKKIISVALLLPQLMCYFSLCDLKHFHSDLFWLLALKSGPCFNYRSEKNRSFPNDHLIYSSLPKLANMTLTACFVCSDLVSLLTHQCNFFVTFSTQQDARGVFIHLLWLSQQPDCQQPFLETAFVFKTPSTCHSPIHKLKETVILSVTLMPLTCTKMAL